MTEEKSEHQDLFDEFDERIKADVDGLIWLGYLEEEVQFCGHSFILRTLKGEDELNAGIVSKEYVETLGQARAWAWAKIALALTSVDNDLNFCPPIGPDKKEFARARFKYVTSNWYWPLGEYLFEQLVILEGRQINAIRALQNLSKRSLPNSTPSQGSLIEQGDSTEAPKTSIPSSITS